MDCIITAPVLLRNISLTCNLQFAENHLLFKICPTGFSQYQFNKIHLGLQAPCCRSYYCCHFVWRHSRCIGLTVQMASVLPIFTSPIPEESTIWMFCVTNGNEYCLHSNNLVHQPPTPRTPNTKQGWNDRQEHCTSAETDRSAVKWFYRPLRLTCLDSLRQSTPATSCPVQGRKYSSKRQRERHGQAQGGKSMLPSLTKTFF